MMSAAMEVDGSVDYGCPDRDGFGQGVLQAYFAGGLTLEPEGILKMKIK